MAQTISDSIKQPGTGNTPDSLDDQPDQTTNPSAPNTAVTGQSQGRPQGTGFTNLQQYLNANTGAGAGLSNAINTGANTVASGVQTGIQQAQNQFNTQANQAYQPFQNGTQFVQNAIQNAANTVQTPNQLQQFQTILGGQYTGPTTLGNQTALTGGVQNLQNIAGLTNTAGGQQQLLNMFVGGNNYTPGESALDQILLQNNANLTGLNQLANNVNQQYNTASGQAAATGQNYQTQAAQLGNQAQQQLGTAQTTEQNLLQSQLASAQANEANLQPEFTQTQQELGQGTLSQADAARLGLTNLAASTPIYNLDLANYLTTNLAANPTNIAQTATSQQAAQANALAQLAGQSSPVNLSQVGTYNPSSQTFNVNAFMAAQQAANQQAQALEAQQAAAQQYQSQLGQLGSGGYSVTNGAPITDQQVQQMIALANTAGIDSSPISNAYASISQIQDPAQKSAAYNAFFNGASDYTIPQGTVPGTTPNVVQQSTGTPNQILQFGGQAISDQAQLAALNQQLQALGVGNMLNIVPNYPGSTTPTTTTTGTPG